MSHSEPVSAADGVAMQPDRNLALELVRPALDAVRDLALGRGSAASTRRGTEFAVRFGQTCGPVMVTVRPVFVPQNSKATCMWERSSCVWMRIQWPVSFCHWRSRLGSKMAASQPTGAPSCV